MKLVLLIAVALATTITAALEVKVSLIPERAMGVRGGAIFQEISWNADSEWFHKAAPVCRANDKPMDLSKFHELAKVYGMTPKWNQYAEQDYGKQSDGAFYYTDPAQDKFSVALGNPKFRKFCFKIARYFKYERDEHDYPVVKPLPSKEQAVAIAQEWMTKLGIDENQLYRNGDEPEGFDIVFRIDLVSGTKPGTTIEKEYHYGITLNFAQQIGGLAVLWHGTGGTLTCEIGDGSEFCSMYGTLSGWEKIGDYPVLNREEVTEALKGKYFWVDTPFECDRIEVIKVRLEAFHGNEDTPQKDFPLIYTFCCKLHGGRDNGREENLYMPALKQQRDRYGPAPADRGPNLEKKERGVVPPSIKGNGI